MASTGLPEEKRKMTTKPTKMLVRIAVAFLTYAVLLILKETGTVQ